MSACKYANPEKPEKQEETQKDSEKKAKKISKKQIYPIDLIDELMYNATVVCTGMKG